MVIGWNDFPGDSDGLGACPWGTILQLAVIGWKAELPWEPRVIISVPLGLVGVRSPGAGGAACPPAGLGASALMARPGKEVVRRMMIINTHPRARGEIISCTEREFERGRERSMKETWNETEREK